MKAKLISLNLNATKRSATGKTLKGVEVTYQGEPYKGQEKEPTTRFLFSDNSVAIKLSDGDIKPGDWVEITFDNDKFKTPNNINKIHVVDSTPSPKAVTPAVGNKSFGTQDPDTQKRIARAVAIKEATALVSELAKHGAYAASKVKSLEFMCEQVLQIAKIYEPYLSCTDKEDKVDKPDLNDADFDQDGFED